MANDDLRYIVQDEQDEQTYLCRMRPDVRVWVVPTPAPQSPPTIRTSRENGEQEKGEYGNLDDSSGSARGEGGQTPFSDCNSDENPIELRKVAKHAGTMH